MWNIFWLQSCQITELTECSRLWSCGKKSDTMLFEYATVQVKKKKINIRSILHSYNRLHKFFSISQLVVEKTSVWAHHPPNMPVTWQSEPCLLQIKKKKKKRMILPHPHECTPPEEKRSDSPVDMLYKRPADLPLHHPPHLLALLTCKRWEMEKFQLITESNE